MSATAAVLDTAELLEAILLQLPLSTILRAQGVNTRFRDVISDSPELQKALFFRPTINRPLRLNRALERHLAVDCEDYLHCVFNSPEPSSSLSTLGGYNRKGTADSPSNILINPCLPMKREQAHYIMLPERQPPHASWRKMLLTQPPIRQMLVADDFTDHWHVVRAAQGARGLTLDDLHQHLKSFMCETVHYFPARGIGRVDEEAGLITASDVTSELTRKANCGRIEDGFNDYQDPKAEMNKKTASSSLEGLPEILRHPPLQPQDP